MIARQQTVGAVDNRDGRIEDWGQHLVAHDLLRITEGHHFPILHRTDVIGVAGSEVDVMQNNDDRAPEVLRG